MFAKLLKHEMKANRGIFTVLSLGALSAGVLGAVMGLLMKNAIMNNDAGSPLAVLGVILSSLTEIGCVLTVAVYAVGVFIMLLTRFYKQHFSDEGYLTFTLPATTHQHLLSSILSIAIWSLIALVVSALSYLVLFSPLYMEAVMRGELYWLSVLWDDFETLLEGLGVGGTVSQIFMILASVLYALVLPLLAITIGALLAKKHKILAAFAVYYGINIAVSIVTTVLTLFTSMRGMVFAAVSPSMGLSGYFTFTNLFNCILYLVLAVGGYFLMHRLIDKKLNLQ